MPIHQEENQVTRAQEHIAWLENKYPNVKHHSLNLSGVFDSFQEILPPTGDEANKFLSLANTRARMRMTTLYYFAALERYLVAGTGNKIEDFGVGFYTKYGDGGVDLSPIADLMKSEVFLLAKTLGVIESIQTAAPTDGLWGDDRTDEDQMGATYDELEWAMKYENDESKNTSERQKEVLAIYKRLHKQNQHKMQPIPVCEIPGEL
jgi:NAD+ synthase